MNIKSKKGFTIIEVVLVLAIAGLIFLMVFIALPNMQRSQRDTQRRQDYSNLSASISSYITNNNGRLPKATATLAPEKYINATGLDPNGIKYKLSVVALTSSNSSYDTAPSSLKDLKTIPNNKSDSTVYVVTNAECTGENADGNAFPIYVKSNRSFAIYGNLESGNGTFCSSSQ